MEVRLALNLSNFPLRFIRFSIFLIPFFNYEISYATNVLDSRNTTFHNLNTIVLEVFLIVLVI